MTPEDVLHFWFTECTPKDWFSKNDELDAKIRTRFEATYHSIVKGETSAWRATPEGRLAEVIVLDQFSRNMFRGTAKAFANDPLALNLAEEAVANGDNMKLEPTKRHFLYMPYMHSESKEVHERGLKLFEALGEAETLKYELEHKAIIDRFGRYPHRNEILNRKSTPEEIEFLKTHVGF